MINSPLEKVKSINIGILYLNSPVVIESCWKGMGAKKIMYMCGPLAKQGENSLRTCYRTILDKAVAEKANTILIPSFSTGKGGFPHLTAAGIAVSEIQKFLADHKNLEVHIVTYLNGSEKDENNWKAYNDIFKNNTCAQLKLVEGEIQNMKGDLIVVPMGKNFRFPGSVCKAVEKAAQTCITNELPPDVLNVILSNLSIKDLGRMASVSRTFNSIQKNPVIWENIARSFNYILDPVNTDIKSQVKDARIDLPDAVADLMNKTIQLKMDILAFRSLHSKQQQKIAQSALSYFPKNYYLDYYYGFGSRCYDYFDEKGISQCVYSTSRMDMSPSVEDEKIIEGLEKNLKNIKLYDCNGEEDVKML